MVFGLCLPAAAQTTAGRVSGSVTDPAGAFAAGVRVTAVNSETGQSLTVKTGGEGLYVLYPLSPGRYKVTAQKDGFSTFFLEGLKVDVSQSVATDIRLEVGAVSQSISVTADSEVIQTDSPAIAATIVNQQIQQLPLNGRDFNQLVLLSAGSVDNATGGNNDFGSVALNGNRTYGNNYMVDGTPNTNSYQGTSAVPLSISPPRGSSARRGRSPLASSAPLPRRSNSPMACSRRRAPTGR